MNIDMKEQVIKLLETYPDRKCKIAALQYELSHPAQVSGNEQLGAMAYAHGSSEGRPGIGHVSNKTMYIALNYQEQTDKLNAAVVDDIAEQLVRLEQEQDRLIYYVSLLDQRHAEVLRRSYFEKEPQEITAGALHISVRTVQTIKSQAIDALVDIYSLTGKLS